MGQGWTHDLSNDTSSIAAARLVLVGDIDIFNGKVNGLRGTENEGEEEVHYNASDNRLLL